MRLGLVDITYEVLYSKDFVDVCDIANFDISEIHYSDRSDVFTLKGTCDAFENIHEGTTIPTYIITVEKDEHEIINVSADKICH